MMLSRNIIRAFLILWVFCTYVFTADAAPQAVAILKTPSSHTWEKILKELGYSPEIVNMATTDIFSGTAEKIMIFPDDFRFATGEEKSMVDKLRSYVGSGGKILAVGKSGFNNGNFHLTPLLCAGASSHAYDIGITYNYRTGKPYCYDVKAFIKRYGDSLTEKLDGLCFYSFIQLKMPTFLPDKAKKKNIPDFEETTASVFKNASKWYQPPDGVSQPIGCHEHVKAMWIRDWMLHRNRGMTAEQIVDICHNIGCNLLILGLEERIAGLKMYDSQLDIIPGYPEYKGTHQKSIDDGKYKAGENPSPIQTDWLDKMVKSCKKYNMNIWLATSIKSRNIYYEFYPEDKGENEKNTMCILKLSQRFFHHEAIRLEEIMKKYPYISGLVLDEPVHHVFFKKQKSAATECFCPECKRDFFEHTGVELNEKTAYEKSGARLQAELNNETAYDNGERTNIYHDYMQYLTIETCVRRYSILLKRIKPTATLAIANYFYGGPLINKMADAGVDILMPEFGGGSSKVPIQWKHKIQRFEFFCLKDGANGQETVKLWGDAVKVKLYAGAEVSAWVSDGNYSYPGIVNANQGRSCYISFDPVCFEYDKGKEIVKEALNNLVGKEVQK